MVSPTTLQKVIADINVNLSLGWAISSDDFWIISLPKQTPRGVRFTIISDFLAVTPDLDTFIELSIIDILHCRQLDKQLCGFHTRFSKRGAF